VFTFTDVIPQDARTACEIMAQEVAHSYGLDHELLASDPMTYLNYNGNRSFQNQAVSCGEDTARPCGINGSTCRANQNSVSLLTERLGANTGQPGDTIAPMIGITSPSNGATVPPGFQINFTASDNVAVTSADLFVDGTPSGSLTQAPYVFTTAQAGANILFAGLEPESPSGFVSLGMIPADRRGLANPQEAAPSEVGVFRLMRPVSLETVPPMD